MTANRRSKSPFSKSLPSLLMCLVLGLGVAAPVLSLGNDWPAWRGPSGNGISTQALPTELRPAAARWVFDLPGESTSTPIVVGDRLFITSQLGIAPIAASQGDDGGDEIGDEVVKFLVLAISLEDGGELWRYQIESDGVLPAVHTKHNLASPSAVSDGERVIAWFGTGQIVSLDLNGKVEWQRHLGREISPFEIRWAHGSSPVLYDDSVILLCDHAPASYLLSVDKRTGATRWTAERGKDKRSYTTPLLIPHGDGHALVVNSNDRIDAYDADDGELLWWVGEPNRVPVSTPVWHDGVLYTSRGYRSGPYMALPTEGRGDKNDQLLWRIPTGAPYVSSLLFWDGLLYLATENGVVSAVDAATGKTVWKERLGGYFSASPLYADGKIVLATEEGELYLIAAGREFELLSKTEYPERIMASPVLANGSLLVRTDSKIFAFR